MYYFYQCLSLKFHEIFPIKIWYLINYLAIYQDFFAHQEYKRSEIPLSRKGINSHQPYLFLDAEPDELDINESPCFTDIREFGIAQHIVQRS